MDARSLSRTLSSDDRVPDRRRETVLLAIAELYLESPPLDEAARTALCDTILAFFDDVSVPVLARLSHVLAPRGDVEPALLRRLVATGGVVAEPVLAASPLLNAAALALVAQTADDVMLAAIACRRPLPASLVEIILSRGGRRAAIALAGNPSLKLTAAQVQILLTHDQPARGDHAVAALLASRSDLDAESRALLLFHLPEDARERLVRAVAADAGRVGLSAAVRALSSPPPGVVARMSASARRGRREEVIAALAELLDDHAVLARRLLDDPGGTVLVVAARAIGLDHEATIDLLTAAPPSVCESMPRLAALMTLFDEVDRSVAIRLTDVWLAAPPGSLPPPLSRQITHEPTSARIVPFAPPVGAAHAA